MVLRGQNQEWLREIFEERFPEGSVEINASKEAINGCRDY